MRNNWSPKFHFCLRRLSGCTLHRRIGLWTPDAQERDIADSPSAAAQLQSDANHSNDRLQQLRISNAGKRIRRTSQRKQRITKYRFICTVQYVVDGRRSCAAALANVGRITVDRSSTSRRQAASPVIRQPVSQTISSQRFYRCIDWKFYQTEQC